MVKIEDIPDTPPMPRRPWFELKEEPEYLTGAREEAIREFARTEGFEDLRGFWKHMQMEEWDYYDIIRMQYE